MLENMLESFLKNVITIEEFTSFLEANEDYSENLTEVALELIPDSSKFELVDSEVEETGAYEVHRFNTYELDFRGKRYCLTVSYWVDERFGPTPGHVQYLRVGF